MVSEFLQTRHARFFKETTGERTIEFTEFNKASIDATTGDVNEAVAYPGPAKYLPAFVDFSPSQAVREKLGLELDFQAAVSVCQKHLDDEQIEPKIGDAMILPGDKSKYYVVKIIKDHQAGSSFLGVLMAAGHKVGRR